MSRRYGDIFKSARLRSGLKREPAAEELHINVRTLDAYESISEDNEPDFRMISQMCKLYGDRSLARHYIKRSELGEFFPEIVDITGAETLQGSTLIAVDRITTAYECVRSIVQIAADGKIESEETDEWKAVQRKLADLIKAATVLLSVKS